MRGDLRTRLDYLYILIAFLHFFFDFQKKKDPARSVKHKINLVWTYYVDDPKLAHWYYMSITVVQSYTGHISWICCRLYCYECALDNDFIIQTFDLIAHSDAAHMTCSTTSDSHMICSYKLQEGFPIHYHTFVWVRRMILPCIGYPWAYLYTAKTLGLL